MADDHNDPNELEAEIEPTFTIEEFEAMLQEAEVDEVPAAQDQPGQQLAQIFFNGNNSYVPTLLSSVPRSQLLQHPGCSAPGQPLQLQPSSSFYQLQESAALQPLAQGAMVAQDSFCFDSTNNNVYPYPSSPGLSIVLTTMSILTQHPQDGDQNDAHPVNKAEFRRVRAKSQPPVWTNEQLDAFFGVGQAAAVQDQQQEGKTENFPTDEDFAELGRILHGDQWDQPAAAEDEPQQKPEFVAPQLPPGSLYHLLQDSAALQPQGQEQPRQLEPGSFESLHGYNNSASSYISSFPSHQQSFNLHESGAPHPHAQLTIVPQGSFSGSNVAESSGAQSQLGLSAFTGGYPYPSVPRLETLSQIPAQGLVTQSTQLHQSSSYGVPNWEACDSSSLTGPNIQYPVPAAPHAREVQQATEAQGRPQNPQGQEPGSFYGGYLPPALPPVDSSFQTFITWCSKPFEKQLARTDVNGYLLRIHDAHFDNHVKQLLNNEEDPENGFQVTVYDCRAKEYQMKFRCKGHNGYFLLGKGWKSFCRDKGLVPDQDWLTIWAFRHAVSQMLSFVIAWRRLEGVTEHIKLGKRKQKDT